MRRPMKEPRSPNEIYFLIQMSRNEKDLSRTERTRSLLFPSVSSSACSKPTRKKRRSEPMRYVPRL